MDTPDLVPWLLYEPEPENGILWIKYNRPDRMNATLGSSHERSTASKVVEYMHHGDDNPDIRVIVLTGVGRGFCAGNDSKGPKDDEDFGDYFPGNRGFEGSPDGQRQHFFHGYTKIIREISLIRKPTIAMMNGPAAGSGMDMAVQCDIRIGCEATKFISYHARGQIIENGGAYFLPRIVGLGRALEFAYVGQIDPNLAHQWGLLNHLVPSEELEKFTREMCGRITRVSPISQWINKRIIRAGLDSNLEGVAVMTSSAATIINLTEDKDEARNASIEKRPPVYKGR
jgi:2-(1,2-epoxy-1,2-dihydrophenyl)acetyl-CoA isomerase